MNAVRQLMCLLPSCVPGQECWASLFLRLLGHRLDVRLATSWKRLDGNGSSKAAAGKLVAVLSAIASKLRSTTHRATKREKRSVPPVASRQKTSPAGRLKQCSATIAQTLQSTPYWHCTSKRTGAQRTGSDQGSKVKLTSWPKGSARAKLDPRVSPSHCHNR